MDRSSAYHLLYAELESLRALAPDALVARIGMTQSATAWLQGQPLEIETTLGWADRDSSSVRITARAFGSAHWHVSERLEESVVVSLG
jgi:hypothetical protein